ncbi:protein FAR1-RELATED SEQUENCE 5-like [Rutidosis leptorrhynchoides]|uniref:protein FAR1-RELATED SEQUENCE 5-like n=1 Tax=Rutidosis leptorrhynchoides TaxID=125765 RepID=UPI003A9A6160
MGDSHNHSSTFSNFADCHPVLNDDGNESDRIVLLDSNADNDYGEGDREANDLEVFEFIDSEGDCLFNLQPGLFNLQADWVQSASRLGSITKIVNLMIIQTEGVRYRLRYKLKVIFESNPVGFSLQPGICVPENYCVGVQSINTAEKRFWTPTVADSVKPLVGMVFDSIESAFTFYSEYAIQGGFEAIKSSSKWAEDASGNKKMTHKYFLCSKHSFKEDKDKNTRKDLICSAEVSVADLGEVSTGDNDNYKKKPKKRKRPSQKVGCCACFVINLNSDNKYQLFKFTDKHNHILVPPEHIKHLKSQRKLSNSQKCFLFQLGQSGIGPNKSYRVLTKVHGGHELVGASKNDCKNWKSDVNKYILKANAKMYDMVFIPFTGIDNHFKCVTFGAALLAKEDVQHYDWLLKAFKKAFPVEPQIVMTDQDPSMLTAVQSVFLTARHRLCIWHITDKITSKVGHAISRAGFKSDISNIVWTDKLDPDEFDRRWDWDMSGLMRTSSRPESENHVFQQLMSRSSTLVEFISFFETAMEIQRYEQSKNDHESLYTTPEIETQHPMEKHAGKVFTRAAFFMIQGQMKAATRYYMSYKIQKLSEDTTKFCIGDTRVKTLSIDETIDRIANPYYFDESIPRFSDVIVNRRTKEIFFNCKMYERVGYFFRHILYVLRMDDVPKTILPSKYIKRR